MSEALLQHAAALLDHPRQDVTAYHAFADHLSEAHPDHPVSHAFSAWASGGQTKTTGVGDRWRALSREIAPSKTDGHMIRGPYDDRDHRLTDEERAEKPDVEYRPEGEKTTAKNPSYARRFSESTWHKRTQDRRPGSHLVTRPLKTKPMTSLEVAREVHAKHGPAGLVHLIIGARHFHPDNTKEAMRDSVVKLAAKHIDIKKDPDYWAFHNNNADDHEHGREFDKNNAAVFADKLQEHNHNDPRADLVRHAHTWYSSRPSGHAAVDHPTAPEGSRGPVGSVKDKDVPSLALSAFPDNAHTSVELHRQIHDKETVPHAPFLATRTYHPILQWQTHIPRTKSTTGKARTSGFSRSVTPDQLHDFIDKIPHKPTQAKWREAAHSYGWHRSTPAAEPVKLRRVTATSTGLAGAVGQAHSAQHDQRLALAKKIFQAGGMKALVMKVLAHTEAGSRPAVAALAHGANPQHAQYVAANVGMMTQEPSLQIFTPGDGTDSLHVFDSPHPTAHVAKVMSSARIGPFVTKEHNGGTRVYAINPEGDPKVLARGIDATAHFSTRGNSDRIGTGTGSTASTGAEQTSARSGYRDAISAGERAAGVK